MINQDCELDAFKRNIDLRQFAENLGYQIDRRESWRGSAVLRCGADKIVVKRNGNGHYVFFSLRDDDDNGTVIDFVQRRQHLSLGAVRQVLRPWIGRSASAAQFPQLPPANPDRMRIERDYRRMAEPQRYPYLERDRCLPAVVLSSPRFRGRMRIDARGNTVFPHFDAAGLCGYEIKNRGFTGFAAGGQKGLWFSHAWPDDWRLVLTESAIDALSYATLFPDSEDQTRYASLGGRPSSRQMELVRAAVSRLAGGAEVVAAFDADEAGCWLVVVIGDVVGTVRHQAARSDLGFRVHLPATEGEDWNQVLVKNRTGSNSACQTGGR
ncbi:MAG TPA: DUF3991 and TOPRIM domain-containing protein [Terracidiphilus sp.]|jgi:hypothetical protein